MKVVNSVLDITSLSDEKSRMISDQCDTCLNDGKVADQCKINADGKCNYQPVMEGFKCHRCIYAIEHMHPKDQAYSYECSIGKFFGSCNAFVSKESSIHLPPVQMPEVKTTMTHNIKILESFADAVHAGIKTFEVRKNDRGYQKGDLVKFTVLYDSDGLEMINHPLHDMTFEITYVLAGWGIEDGYVVFGIRKVGGVE